MRLNEVYRNSGLGKWFHGESATKEPGWDRYNSEGKRVGKCGDAKEGSAYSACLSKQKAQKLGKEGRSSFVKRKRAAQNQAGRGEKGTGKKGKKPINVDTGASKMEECYECEQEIILEGKNKPNDPEKWSACKSAAKSKFDVYPSAYANAWAAKCYKKKGGSWRSVKESTEMDEFKSLIKENIVFNFLENAKPEFARRGAGRQRPKSWNKGTKSGSEKRKMREQGKRESDQREVYEGVSPFKRWELHQELKHEDTPNFERNMRQDAEIARMDQNAKWSMQRLLPVYEKHGMAEEHAARTDQYGFPVFAHAITHPNFKAFAKDFIDFHTIENKKHWAEHGKASSFHWPAILRAKQGLESLRQHEEYVAKKQQSSGDLTEGESWGPEFAGSSQDDATAKAYEDEAREAAMRQRGPVSHDEMMKKIQQAHEGALSHTYTAHTMGKHKKQDSHHMLSKYIEHFRHLMGPGSSD